MELSLFGDAKYVVNFVDGYSRFVNAYFIQRKSQLFEHFVEYKSMMERKLGSKIKCIRADNGKEFINSQFSRECRKDGIIHQTTVPHCPQQNGVVERIDRTLMDRARAMLKHKNVEKNWWAEALNTAAYVTNRLANSTRPWITPLEVCFGSKPDIDHFRVYGSTGYAYIDKSKRSKLQQNAFPCFFLGYANNSRGYQFYNNDSRKESPGTYKEAIERYDSQHWIEAIKSELVPLEIKCTWKFTDRPLLQMDFHMKRDEKEKIQRHKAQLVAQGFRQIPGVDFKETYAPVASMNSIRIFPALCCHMRYEIYQYDVDTAFLNGYIDEDIYM
uniref:Retrotransposon protein putative n=1 Tax=Albugo laibachii Nc14 TaxID=890382 RepID=F0WIU9_9STRA|nr:retrotransposon protein putative [Albugo laibachii Nc14]|eukprot:CCA21193.1 retrotransposon protein putative [Albugo laibachii Nc14]